MRPTSAGLPAPLTASAFNLHYARDRGTGLTVMQESPFSSLAVARATASTHSCLPTEGWLRLSRGGCLDLCRGGLPVQRQSPIQALTRASVE